MLRTLEKLHCPHGLRLVISGTRLGRPDVWYWLDRWMRRHGPPGLLIVGCARGVDAQAIAWAVERNVRYQVFRAAWRRPDGSKDLSAGNKRNAAMVAAARPGDWLLAFPDVESRGTPDCAAKGRRAGLRVHVCPPAWPSRSGVLPSLKVRRVVSSAWTSSLESRLAARWAL